jgi:ArsR family transcriptional regulator
MSKYKTIDMQGYADIFKALSNPHRLKIFMKLACCGSEGIACKSDKACECVGDLGSNMGIAPSTISHHLKELHRSGLICTRRNGQRIECWVDPEILQSICSFFTCKAKE